ncbi:MAG: GNAT family N-acetyltransferase [Clostridium sp.]|nr:GNAT family N-acetyltransferase [Clostridium sp.]
MKINFRNYTTEAGITEDYHKVREFLVKRGYSEFTYARWDWMTTHSYLDKSVLNKIGIWEDDEKIVGLAVCDCHLGDSFCLALPDYNYLREEILLYAKDNMKSKDNFGVIIEDSDIEFQNIASNLGLIPTTEKENDAIFYMDRTSIDYELPEGFYITSMKDTFDLYQYNRVLWKGFNHELNGEGELIFTEEDEKETEASMIRPNLDLNLKIAVVAPDGNFASYCGMWYDKDVDFAIIEPVATDPEYRKLGLGKAAVLEGIKRVGLLGAKKAIVGSSQQFYYSIGLKPYKTSTIWREKSIN